jgi:hypothetical protein
MHARALLAGAVLLVTAAFSTHAAPTSDCTQEAAALSGEEAELPRLEIASPRDRPPYCITLETLIGFAGRVKAHLAQCPNSDYATPGTGWLKAHTNYQKLFTQHRCKRTLSP